MTYRLLQSSDFNKGFLELLGQLTTVGDISKEAFIKRLAEISKNSLHKIFVLERDNKIISCATLIVENKFIHSCGRVGHVEDVVVHSGYRSMQLGKIMINYLSKEAEKMGCYKIILDCADKNIEFYKKCLYEYKGAHMARYLNPVIVNPKTTSTMWGSLYGFVSENRNVIAITAGVSLLCYLAYSELSENVDNDFEHLEVIPVLW